MPDSTSHCWRKASCDGPLSTITLYCGAFDTKYLSLPAPYTKPLYPALSNLLELAMPGVTAKQDVLAKQYLLPHLDALLSTPIGQDIRLVHPDLMLSGSGVSVLGQLIAETCADGYEVFVWTQNDHLLNALRIAILRRIIKPIQLNVVFFSLGWRKASCDDASGKEHNVRFDSNGRTSNWPDGFFDQWDKDTEVMLCLDTTTPESIRKCVYS